jgi:hypothetical protein
MTRSLDFEELGEAYANAVQRIGELEGLVNNMQVALGEGSLDEKALEVARQIEDLFVQSHPGGRSQRLAKIQVLVRETVRVATTGQRRWDAWRPGGVGPEPREPEESCK